MFIALMVLLVWLPIPVGSASDLSTGLMLILSIGLMVLWSAKGVCFPQTATGYVASYKAIIALFVLAMAYQLLQIVPLPPGLGAALNHAARDAYAATPGFDKRTWTPLSIDAGSTLTEALKSASYISLFVITLALVNTRRRMKQALWTLVAIGFFQALAGLSDAFYSGELFGNALRGFGAQGVAGTYANRNIFAGLLELTIPICVALLLHAAGRESRPTFKATPTLREALEWILGRRALIYLMLATMVAGLLFSTSRGGIFSLAIASVLMLLWAKLDPARANTKQKSMWSLFAAVGLAAVLGAQPLLDRLQSQGLETDRSLHRAMAYRVVADYPVFGSGAGSWWQVYTAYQEPETYSQKIVNRVHNDYLDLLVEQGLLGFVIFGGALLWTLTNIARGLLLQKDPLYRATIWGALTGIISTLIHSVGDFSLHIPANAAIFTVIMALGLIAAKAGNGTVKAA